MFQDLREVILEVLAEACNITDAQREAWELLFNFTYGILFEKLEDHCHEDHVRKDSGSGNEKDTSE